MPVAGQTFDEVIPRKATPRGKCKHENGFATIETCPEVTYEIKNGVAKEQHPARIEEAVVYDCTDCGMHKRFLPSQVTKWIRARLEGASS